jgi:hypothetical protein
MAEEGNRKLLEFADCKRRQVTDGNFYWFSPDGRILPTDGKRNPIIDLGWLFKYVVPKLRERELAISLYSAGNFEAYSVKILNTDIQKSPLSIGLAKEPQVALANAILKWLEGQGK